MGFGCLHLFSKADLLQFKEFADRAIVHEEFLDIHSLLRGPAQGFISDHPRRRYVHDRLKDDADHGVVQLVFLFPDVDLVAPLLRDVQGSVGEADEMI